MNIKMRLLLAALACTPLVAAAEPGPMSSGPAPMAQAEGAPSPRPHGMPMEGNHDRSGPGPQMGHPGEMEPGFGLPTPPWLHGLKLSDAQEDKIFTIVYEQIPAAREQMKTLHQVHEALRDLPFADKFDASRAKSLTEQMARATAALELARTTAQNKIWNVLTPEQRKEITERKQHPEGHGEMPPPAPAKHEGK